MNPKTRVAVVRYRDRKHLVLRWHDPETGRQRTKSAKTTRRRDAEREAARLEADLKAGKLSGPPAWTWAHFKAQYQEQHLSGLADRTFRTMLTVAGHVERICAPALVSSLTSDKISRFQSTLRAEGKSEATIASYSRTLKAALRWAAEVGIISEAPTIRMPKRAKGKTMRGRPITAEEYWRLLQAVPAVVGAEAAPSWQHYLEGLWWSGLRLSESLELYWDRPDKLAVDLTGRRPMLLIPADLEKGNKDRILPLAPEAARFLLRTPESKRKGRVFRLQCPADMLKMSMRADTVSKYVCKIGKKAAVKVEDTKRNGKPFVKFASCHDLRRSFGERWAARVMPNVLMELMRHESIDTTMKYYVGRNAQRTADQLWAAVEADEAKSNISVTVGPEAEFGEARKSTQVLGQLTLT